MDICQERNGITMDSRTKKLVFNIIYFVMGGLSLLMTLMSFYQLNITVSLWGIKAGSGSIKFSAYKWIGFCMDPAKTFTGALGDYGMSGAISVPILAKILSILIILIPIAAVIGGIVMQALSMKKNKWNLIYAAFPGAAAVVTIIGAIITNIVLKMVIKSAFGSYEGLGSSVGNMFSVKPGAGLILFVLFNIVAAVIAALLLPGLNTVSFGQRQEYAQNPNVVPDLYPPQPQQRPQTAPGPKPASILCLRGQYQGAGFAINPGEVVYFGRDNKVCQLVFDDPHISRKHCSVAYSPSDDKFIITNHSKNGMQLADGTELAVDSPVKISRGTAFRINEDNVFKTM